MVPLRSMPGNRYLRHSLCAIVALFLLAPTLAQATVDPERIEDTQTAWYYLSNVTEAQITDQINNFNARLTDIEIYSESPLRFTCAFVKNQGIYASGFWWYFGLTLADIGTFLTNNDARLIDIERYIDGGNERFAVVMVPNTGAQQKAWWYYVGTTTTDISTYLSNNNARLIDLESYSTVSGTRYAAIMIANTGEDAAGWAWYYNTDLTTIQNYMDANNMRILEFEVRDPATPTFDAILIDEGYHTPATWWWYYGLTFDQVGQKASQAGSRIVDIDHYLNGGGQDRYNIVLLNNSSNLTVQIGSILEWGSDGDTGCYLREINGPTYASLQPDFQFEPASTMKTTYHLKAIREVMAGNITLLTPINYSVNYSGSCPIGGAPFDSQPLQEVLRRMMVNSDNAAAKAIADLYGLPAINATAQNIAGMTSTLAQHTLGCGSDAIANPNMMTLRDAGELFERIETLQILSTPMRDTYYSLMQNQDTPSPWWFTTDLKDLVNEVATSLGIGNTADSYWANVREAWKPGGYTLIFNSTNHEYIAIAGIVSLPTCATFPRLVYRDFVFGVFVNNGSNNTDTFNRVETAAKELFRGVMSETMRTCPTAVAEEIPSASRPMLQPNFPNPFNPRTRLAFDIEQAGPVSLMIYDASGRKVAVLADAIFEAGHYVRSWDGRDDSGKAMPSGVYLAHLKAGDRVETQKMALLK